MLHIRLCFQQQRLPVACAEFHFVKISLATTNVSAFSQEPKREKQAQVEHLLDVLDLHVSAGSDCLSINATRTAISWLQWCKSKCRTTVVLN